MQATTQDTEPEIKLPYELINVLKILVCRFELEVITEEYENVIRLVYLLFPSDKVDERIHPVGDVVIGKIRVIYDWFIPTVVVPAETTRARVVVVYCVSK